MDILTKQIDKAKKEFRSKFYGQLNAIDDTGGFDAKPYIESFLEQSIRESVMAAVKFQKEDMVKALLDYSQENIKEKDKIVFAEAIAGAAGYLAGMEHSLSKNR